MKIMSSLLLDLSKVYLLFNDVCHLAIKIEKQLKDRRLFPSPSPHQPQSTPKCFSSHSKVDLPLLLSRPWIRERELLVSVLKG